MKRMGEKTEYLGNVYAPHRAVGVMVSCVNGTGTLTWGEKSDSFTV